MGISFIEDALEMAWQINDKYSFSTSNLHGIQTKKTS